MNANKICFKMIILTVKHKFSLSLTLIESLVLMKLSHALVSILKGTTKNQEKLLHNKYINYNSHF